MEAWHPEGSSVVRTQDQTDISQHHLIDTTPFPRGSHSRQRSPSYSTDTRLFVLCGVVLIDLLYHQALATVLVLLVASRPVKGAQRWLDALAGALLTAFGLRLLVDAVRAR
jgi:arginine exporter protein ArgO